MFESMSCTHTAGRDILCQDMESKSLAKDDFYFLSYALRFNFLINQMNLSKCFVTDDDVRLLASSLEFNIVLSALIMR